MNAQKNDDLLPERSHVEFLIGMVFVGAMLCMMVWSTLIYTNVHEEGIAAEWVSHTYQVREALRSMIAGLTDAETSQRGFLITSQKRYLETYRAATSLTSAKLDEVATLIKNNEQQQRASQLRSLAQERMKLLEKDLALAKDDDKRAVLPNLDRGENLTNRIRVKVAGMLQEEERLLATRRLALHRVEGTSKWLVILGSVAMVLLLAVAAALVFRRISRDERSVQLEQLQAKPGRQWTSYLIVVVAVAVAALSRMVIGRVFGETFPPYMTFFPAVIAAAIFGGVLAGVTATLLSALTVAFLFLEPIGSLWVIEPVEQAGLFLFVIINVLSSVASGALRASRLREQTSMREMRQMLDLEDLGVFIVLSLDGSILRWSGGCQRLYGFTAEQAVGQNIHRLLHTRFPQPLQDFRTALFRSSHWSGELVHTCADHTKRTVMSEWLVWHNHIGKPTAILEVNTDITEIKKAQQQLRLQSAALSAAADGVVITDRNGMILWVNASFTRMTGYLPQEVIGRNPRVLKSGRHNREFYQQLWQMILRGEVWHGQVLNRRKDGTFYDEEMTIAPVRDERGEISHFVSLKRDITERKQAEAALRETRDQLAQMNRGLEDLMQDRTVELRETVEELERFSYSITHDMRAPLRAMRSYASLLLKQNQSRWTDDEKDWLENIATSAEQMDRLILDALDYGKALRQSLPLAVVDVDALVRGILRSYPTFHPSMAKIEIQEKLPPVMGNRTALTQCFANLLDNAVKFVQPGQMPQVRIRADLHDARVRLWVEDNGIGIAQEHHERIFEMFQRLNENYEGTGIGLALVRKVVEKMNGRVGVESEPGRGSRFWVELAAAGTERQEIA